MSTNVKPVEQLEFRGVCTAGNPLSRPRSTAEICENLRVMPGAWLRLRSGRKLRATGSGGTVRQIGSMRSRDFWGKDKHLAQVGAEWRNLNVAVPAYTPGSTVEPIQTTLDGGFANSNPVAFCNLSDRPLFYNGRGERAADGSFPPFSTYTTDGKLRYFGLDGYFFGYTTPGEFDPFGAPEANFTDGGSNKWLFSLAIYVGLWNRETDHYSNGQWVHFWQTPQTTGVTIEITDLQRLLVAYHDASELSELFYVFYATIDGGRVPYLILNKALDGPFAVPATSTTATLSIEDTVDIGFVHDLVHEMPQENHPPRPMRSIATVNGRLFGVLMPGGSFRNNMIANPGISGVDYLPGYNMFDYVPLARDLAAVVWSAAQGDNLGSDWLGDPLQSWPYPNIAYTPSVEQPLAVAAAPVDANREAGEVCLVITNTHTFYLQEQADGVMDWITLSPLHGISVASTLRTTEQGMAWVTQRNQIVLLRPGALRLEIISLEYQSLLDGLTPTCADYILDPVEQIDRYQVWFSNGTSLCHDFLIGELGRAYTCTNQDFTAALSTADNNGKVHHILAKTGYYTHEGQPEGTGIPTTDAGTEITGVYRRNWDDFGDADVRKELPMLDVIGDVDVAASMAASPLVVNWYGDLEEVSPANKKTAFAEKVSQSVTDSKWRYKLASSHKFWFKLIFTLAGHSADNGGADSKYPPPWGEGNHAKNFYGSILRLLWRLGVSENRA